MNTVNQMFESAINHWRNSRGIGTALIPFPLDDRAMILGILQRVYERSPTVKTLILLNDYKDRINIIEYLTQQEGADENNEEFKKLIKDKTISVLTYDFLDTHSLHIFPYLLFCYRPVNMSSSTFNLLEVSKYKLVIMNKLLSNVDDSVKLNKIAPILDDFKANEVAEIRSSTPVEEMRIGIALDKDSNDYKLLKYCNDYITTSLNVFGSFDILNEARMGNKTLNISAAQVCENISKDNGWSPTLDMSIKINRDIDEIYNPGAIKDRAIQTYEEIRKRNVLLSSNKSKLAKIYEIVNNNRDKKILIISKHGEFASEITEYLNNNSDKDICGNYHDKVLPVPAVDTNGNPVYYKSGANKGQRRMMAAQAQKTYNEYAFNNGVINVLSTNNAPDKELAIKVDIIIITSPLCDDIKTYIYRLSNLVFGYKIELYSLFILDSLEQKQIESKSLLENHLVVNNYGENEENCGFTIVD